MGYAVPCGEEGDRERGCAPAPSQVNTEYMHIFSLHRVRLGHGVRIVVGGRGYSYLPTYAPDLSQLNTEYMHIFSLHGVRLGHGGEEGAGGRRIPLPQLPLGYTYLCPRPQPAEY